MIASTDKAVQDGKNSFTTASLSTSDIQNKADYQGSSVGINIGAGYSASGALTPGGTSAGLGKESGSASSTTQSGISGMAGNKAIRTGDKETGIGTIFDASKVQQSIDAQVKITQMFNQLAPKAVGDYAHGKLNEANALKAAAQLEPDKDKQAVMQQQASEMSANWAEGGAYRVALHTAVGGLSGNLQGAVGAGLSAYTIPEIAKEINKLDIPAELKQGLVAIAGTAVGAAVGGVNGAAAGVNQTVNNCLAHGRDCFDSYNQPLPPGYDSKKLYAVQPTVLEYILHFIGGTKEDVYRLGSDVNLSAYEGRPLVQNSKGDYESPPLY